MDLGSIGPSGGFFDIGIGDITIPQMSSLTGWINWATELFFENFQIPAFDRRDLATIPVGDPNFQPPPEISRDELSDLVIAERQPTIPEKVIMPVVAVDWFDYWEKIGAGINVLAPGTKDTDMSNGTFWDDLGDLGIDIASEWARNRFPVGMASPMGFTASTGGGGPSYSSDDPLVPPPSAPASVVCPTGPSPVWKKVCGVYKWVYPKRRRRRELLTESDFNALLRIQNLKVNANMTMAISKAITR